MTDWKLLLRIVGTALASTACVTGRGGPGSRPTPVVRSLRAGIDSLIDDPKFRSAQWGVLVVDPGSGDTLYSRNAGKLFMPASNQKILTAAVALHLLGPSFRFTTDVAASAPVIDGVIAGDLVLRGTGDPSVSDHMRSDAMTPLRQIADSLAVRGVRRITGRLTNGADTFSDATLGFGWSWDDLDFAYSAGVDELYFNEGFSRIVVRGGARIGDSADVRTAPARMYPRVRNAVMTAPQSGSPPRNRISARQDSSDAGAVIVSGTVAPGDSVVETITFRDPAASYLEALREALAERGIAAEQGVQSRTAGDRTALRAADSANSNATLRLAIQADTWPLFTMLSPPLREILPPFLKPSQNQIGEILLKTLGRVVAGAGRADSGAAVVRRQLLEWGAAADGFVVRDGSGLSRHDMVSPETLVRVLDAIRADTAFAVFYEGLPVAGVDGTVASRMRGTAAQSNVHAKTGSLDMVRSLSGYVTTADGPQLIFSVLCNNWIVPANQVTLVLDAIATRLAQLRLGR